MLYRAGGEPPNFFVVLEGEIEIVREGHHEVVLAAHGPSRIVGELSLEAGRRPYLGARWRQVPGSACGHCAPLVVLRGGSVCGRRGVGRGSS
jgi:hypothetical protein